MTKFTHRLILLLGIVITITSALVLSGCATDGSDSLICDFNELMSAVKDAEDGDVILVGDVDFTPTSPDFPYSMMNIEIVKSITIKNGKRDGKALFKNAGFILTGSKVSGETLTVHFDGIVFDGLADYENLTAADYDYPWDPVAEDYLHYFPMKAQQAFTLKGNVDASFSDCDIRNYMHEYGPVIDLRYADYTDNEYLLGIFGDQSGCRINLNFDSCTIENNSARYDGGAIYIESNNNVTLNAVDCTFSGNRSTDEEYARGGGAIYASGAMINLVDCKLENNTANHVFPDLELPESDTHKGGALMLEGSKLTAVNTIFEANRASMGGALSMTNVTADIDGCTFTKNRAEAFATNPYNSHGPWSNMEQGGAIYLEGIGGDTVTLVNCEITENSAKTAYGGIYSYHSPNDDLSFGTYYLSMLFCNHTDNTVDTVYDYSAEQIYPWLSHPGDMFENPHLTMYACYITDPSFENDFPRNDLPSAENGYNYLAPTHDEASAKLKIDSSKAAEKLGGRYGDKLKNPHVGSNYSSALYKRAGESISPLPFIIVGVIILCAAGAVIFLLRRRISPLPSVPEPIGAQPVITEPIDEKKIVMTRYTDEEIDRYIALVPETQRLTGRELEVLRELLRGRKQSEVAYYLGIEVSTVKDFYRKIYDKLGVPNKQALLEAATEALNKQPH